MQETQNIETTEQELVEKSFDYRTHIRDPKTGQVAKHQPYKMVVSRDAGTKLERPIGSGFWYAPNGDLISKPETKAQETKEQTNKAK